MDCAIVTIPRLWPVVITSLSMKLPLLLMMFLAPFVATSISHAAVCPPSIVGTSSWWMTVNCAMHALPWLLRSARCCAMDLV